MSAMSETKTYQCPTCGSVSERKTVCLNCGDIRSLAAPLGSETGTIRNIGRGPDGKAFVVYLRDNIRISVGRTMDTHGPAWLEITETPVVRSQNSRICETAQD